VSKARHWQTGAVFALKMSFDADTDMEDEAKVRRRAAGSPHVINCHARLRGPADEPAFALEFMDAASRSHILCRRRGRRSHRSPRRLRTASWGWHSSTPVASRTSMSSRTASSPTPAAAAATGRKICNRDPIICIEPPILIYKFTNSTLLRIGSASCPSAARLLPPPASCPPETYGTILALFESGKPRSSSC
jgi:hypothetical protein